MNKCHGNFINGNFTSERGDFEKIDPVTEEAIGGFPHSGAGEVQEAVETARQAFPRWRSLSRVHRAELFDNLAQAMKYRKEEIARTISLETGKTLNESMAEVVESLHMIQYTAGKGREPCGELVASELADRDCMVIRKPKGVVAVIAPWNFPCAIPGAWTTAPALLEGNTVVLKPSEDSPLTGELIAELYSNAGFPAGVFNLVHGDGKTGDLLSRHVAVDHICFTGSYAVSKYIREACAFSDHTTCSCETGSKSAVIVFEDGDLKLAAEAAANSAFKLSGQRCVSAGRILVQRSVFNAFIDKFLTIAKQAVVAGPFEEPGNANRLHFGPLINKSQMEKVMKFNDLVRDDTEAKVLWDQDGIHGRLPRKGFFLRPFVYKCEWRDKPYLKQEVFGPHVAIIPFDDADDAIGVFNDTAFGLSVSAVTEDFRLMRYLRNELDAGMMYFNLGCIGAESHAPFSGVKNSGYGGGSAAGTFDAVVHKVVVSTNHSRTLSFPQGLK